MASLLDEILEANQAFLKGEPVPRPVSLGDKKLLVLTCIDPRLTALIPKAMGVAPEEMYAVRNAGNRACGTNGHAIRSICATLVLGHTTEVFVVGHTDCAMRNVTAMALLDGMRKHGMERSVLGGEDVRGWFGAISSERSNAMEAARAIRGSPVVPPGTPVHALLVKTDTGALEVLESGYDRAKIEGASRLTTLSPEPSPPVSTFRDLDPSEIVPVTEELQPPPTLESIPPPPSHRPEPPPELAPERREERDSPFKRAEDVFERYKKRRK